MFIQKEIELESINLNYCPSFQVYLEGKDTLDRLECISTALSEVFQTDEGVSNSFPTCNQLTYGTFLRGAFRALYESADNITESNQTQLGSWGRILDILDNLMTSVKNKEEATPDCLEHGRAIMNLFHENWIPFREEIWKNSSNQFQGLLRRLQNVIDTLNEVKTLKCSLNSKRNIAIDVK